MKTRLPTPRPSHRGFHSALRQHGWVILMGLALGCTTPSQTSWSQAPTIRLSPAQVDRVGQRIWQNECGGTVAGLTSWNQGEDFASLGIGHFIWYPAGQRGPFEESFPPLVAYLSQQGIPLP